MNMLAEEYNNYLELISTKEKLNTELLNLSGKKDPDSVKKINDLGAKLGDINNELLVFFPYTKSEDDFEEDALV